MRLAHFAWIASAFGTLVTTGCQGEYVGVEPPQGFGTEKIEGPVSSDLPPVEVPRVVVWGDELSVRLEVPAEVEGGAMLHFEGVIDNPHFPGTAFVRVQVLKRLPNGQRTPVEAGVGTPGPYERDGMPTYNADLEENEYRIGIRVPEESGVYDVEVSYLAFPVGTTPEMFPDPWPEGYAPPQQERFLFAIGELTVTESSE